MTEAPEERLIVRSAGLRAAVERERDRIKREDGMDLTLSKTAAMLIRAGLRDRGSTGGGHAGT